MVSWLGAAHTQSWKSIKGHSEVCRRLQANTIHPLPLASKTASATDLGSLLSVNPDGMSTHFSQAVCLRGDKGHLIEDADEEKLRTNIQGAVVPCEVPI